MVKIPEIKKIKITGDDHALGLSPHINVVDAETGESLNNVIKEISVHIKAGEPIIAFVQYAGQQVKIDDISIAAKNEMAISEKSKE